MKRIVLAVLSLSVLTNLYAGDMKINGDTHFNYSFEDADNNAFQLSRAYFTFTNKVSDNISYKFQTDIGSGGATAYTVYLKNANLAWKSDFGKFVFGLQGMNMFGIQEGNWGYRFIEKSAMDLNKYSSSADLGISWEKSLGALTPSVQLSNGTGYKKAEDDKYKKLSFRLLYGEAKLKKGFNAGVSLSLESEDYLDANTETQKGSTQVLGVFGGFAAGPLKIGGEFAMRNNSMDTDKSANFVSAYANYKISDQLSGFGRLDLVDQDSDTDGDGFNYLILGMNYQIEKVLNIAPTMKMKNPETGDAEIVYQVNFRFNI